MSRYRGARLLVSLSAVFAILFSMAVTVGAAPSTQAAPTITSSTNNGIVPFNVNTTVITADTGTGGPGTLCFAYTPGATRSATTATLVSNFTGNSGPIQFPGINQSGIYSFFLFPGTLSTCPAPSTASVILDLTKANPFGGIGTSLRLIAPTQPTNGVQPCQPATSGVSNGGGFAGTDAVNNQQYPPLNSLSPAAAGVRNSTSYSANSSANVPRTVCVAFDAGFAPATASTPATARPEVLVYYSVNGSTPALFTRGPFGYIPFDFVVSGSYSFLLYLPGTTPTPIVNGTAACSAFTCQSGFTTTAGVATPNTTYAGGTAAIVPFFYDGGPQVNAVNLAPGGPTAVCIGTSAGGALGTIPPIAGGGTVASYTNNGALRASVGNLVVNTVASPTYTLRLVTVSFATGPQFIVSTTAGSCGAASFSNGTAALATVTPIMNTANDPALVAAPLTTTFAVTA